MKALYFTDTHDMGRNPGARIDDYHQAIMRKFHEAVNTAIKEKVSFVVHGGDWWHTPKVANSIYNQHQRLLRKLRRKKIKVFVVPGNHDLYGYSMDTLDQTSLGSLVDAGLVTLLTRNKGKLLDDGIVKVQLLGREYSADIDQDPLKDYHVKINNKADWNFLFAHGMLLDKPFHPDVRYTLTKDVVTDADAVFTGHYHPGYKTHFVGSTEFFNIGSTGRDEGSVDSVNRIPQYAIINFEKDDYQVDVRPYKCAVDGNKVFDRSQIVQKKTHERYLEAFEQTVVDAIAFDSFDPKDILAKTTGISKKIMNHAMQAVVEQEKLSQAGKLDGYVVKKAPIGIDSIDIENFQSHRKTVVNFDHRGLNAITGPSDSGKSSIIRAIRWVLYNEPRGMDFIRHGASRATVTISFTDGSSITRSRTRSTAGEYIVRDSAGKETVFKGFGNNPPIDIANTHQMPKVELSPGVERPLNFAYQLDGHFLLSDSPATRAATLGRLTGVHLVDGAVKEVSKEIRKVTIDTNGAEKRIGELEAQIQTFAHLPEREQQIKVVQGLLLSGEYLEKQIIELQQLYDFYHDSTDMVKSYKDELALYADVDKGLLLLEDIEKQILEIKELEREESDLKLADRNIAAMEQELQDLQHVDTGIQLLEKADALQKETETLHHLLDEYETGTTLERRISKELKQYDSISQYQNLDHLDELFDEIEEARLLFEHSRQTEKDVERLEEDLNEATTDVEWIEQQIKDLVGEMGACPTCNQDINAHALDEMLSHI